jgi:hypothetical protein
MNAQLEIPQLLHLYLIELLLFQALDRSCQVQHSTKLCLNFFSKAVCPNTGKARDFLAAEIQI